MENPIYPFADPYCCWLPSATLSAEAQAQALRTRLAVPKGVTGRTAELGGLVMGLPP